MLRSACGVLLRPKLPMAIGKSLRLDRASPVSSCTSQGVWNFSTGRRWMSILPTTERKLIKLSGEDFHPKEVYKWKPLYCRYGVAALDHGYVTNKCIEAIAKVLKRRLKPERLVIRINPKQPVTKKSIGKKMGGGKGKLVHRQCWVRRGKIILEFDTDQETKAIEAARGVNLRLPMRSVFIRKPKTAKEIEFEKMLAGTLYK